MSDRTISGRFAELITLGTRSGRLVVAGLAPIIDGVVPIQSLVV